MMVHHFTRHKPMEETYNWIPEAPAYEIGDSGPIMRLRMVREGRRQCATRAGDERNQREIGARLHHGAGQCKAGQWFRRARSLGRSGNRSPHGIRLRSERPRTNTPAAFRIYNCQWNIEIPDRLSSIRSRRPATKTSRRRTMTNASPKLRKRCGCTPSSAAAVSRKVRPFDADAVYS